MIAAVLTVLFVIATGLAGFRLIPDSGVYADGGIQLTPSFLGGLAGELAGIHGLIYLSALAAGICVLLIPGRRRWAYAAVCAYWFAFPGVDALGALFVLYMLYSRTQLKRSSSWLLAGLAHPVAALTTWPLLIRRDRLGLAAVAVLTIAAIVGVGLYDGFSTTDRYALPLISAWLLLA